MAPNGTPAQPATLKAAAALLAAFLFVLPFSSTLALRNALLGPRGARVKPIVDTPPLYTEPEADWVQEVFEVCAPLLDARPTPRTITFSTDGAWLKPGYGGPPAVILGPGEPKLAHQTDEWCSLTRIEESTQLFRGLMRDWQR